MKKRYGPAAGPLAVAAALWVLAAWTSHGRVLAQVNSRAVLNDPVSLLARAIDSGETTLEFRERTGYLESLLQQLDLHVDSQLLVFSKTSFQQKLISPRTPRAVFFNDKVAVGSVQGGDVFELMSLDPAQGFVFYTLGAHPSDKPRFERRGVECEFCHLPGSHGAPGLVVASVIPDAQGVPFFTGTFFATTEQRTPFDQRWGGWYVTGTHGSQTHLGNAIAPDPDRPVDLDQTASLNVTSLAGRFDGSHYLSMTSDIVALMTLEHQAGVTNRILGLTRQYERSQRLAQTDKTARALDESVDDLVANMVFADEAALKARVKGVSTFTTTFAARGPRDADGRSLRDFDLDTRLFRYSLSYMIYSEVFDSMPPRLRDRVYRRLHDVLTGTERSGRFAGLSDERCRAALEILLDTKENLPADWRPAPASP